MSSRRNVEILFGAPGCGKTTALIHEVKLALQAGIAPQEIAFFSFTRKAAYEAIDRACKEFGLSKVDFEWFRTLHSAAFRLLELKKGDVMSTDNFRELGESLGLIFQGTYDHMTERVPIDVTGNGDRCMAIYAKWKARQTSLEEEWRRANYYELPFAVVKKFAANLDEYKKMKGLVDFTDMIDMCQSTLPVHTFIGDEAQDFTNQQWGLMRRLGASAENVFLGGDDDQAIYGWSGANYLPLLELKGKRRILPVSHRLPRSIKSLCDRVSSRIKLRQPKSFASREDDGRISWIREPEFVDLSEGSWLLLARNRHNLQRLEELCRRQFVVYHSTNGWSNSAPAIRAVVTFERLRRGEAISPSEYRSLSRYLPRHPECSTADKVQWNDITWPEGITPNVNWMECLELDVSEREYIRGLLRRGESLMKAGRVHISTVHGAKGGEAQNVLLMTDVTRRVAEGMVKNPDDEWRVLYVGVSRAINSLTLVHPTGKNFWRIP